MEIPDKHKAEKALRKMAQPWPSSRVTQQSFVDLVKNNERRFDSEKDHGFMFGGFVFFSLFLHRFVCVFVVQNTCFVLMWLVSIGYMVDDMAKCYWLSYS